MLAALAAAHCLAIHVHTYPGHATTQKKGVPPGHSDCFRSGRGIITLSQVDIMSTHFTPLGGPEGGRQ